MVDRGGVPGPDEVDAAVVVYSTRFCGFCRMAAGLLTRRGIGFEEIDVTQNGEARTWLREHTGRRTVPQIFIRGESIGGFQELAAMDSTGALAEALAG